MSENNPSSRRSFFKQGLNKLVQLGTEVAEQKLAQKAKNWIRPPFAIAELDFLLACNRCGDCISACPYDVVFPLPVTHGVEVAETPALDLLNKGCHLCTDWPCVTACESNALSFSYFEKNERDTIGEDKPDAVKKIMPMANACPPMAKASINMHECMPYSGPECGACKGSCPIPDTLNWHNEKPDINVNTCIGCGLCREACITSPKSIDLSKL